MEQFHALLRALWPVDWLSKHAEYDQRLTLTEILPPKNTPNCRLGRSVHLPLATVVETGDGLDVLGNSFYFGLASRQAGLGPSQRGKRGELIAIPGVAVDIDTLQPGHHKAENLPPDIEAALSLLGLPEPTSLVGTGGGGHNYFAFHEPIIIDTERKVRYLAKTFKQWQKGLRETFKKRGWVLDDTSAPGRIWRPPGTINIKTDPPKEVRTLIINEGLRYHPDELFGKEKKTQVDVKEALTKASDDIDGTKNVQLLAVRRRLRKKVEQGHHLAFAIENLLKGKSLCDTERDNMLQAVCSVVGYNALAANMDAEVLAELFEDSMKAWASEPGAQKTFEEEMEKVHDKLQRAQVDWENKQAERLEYFRPFMEAVGVDSGGNKPDEVLGILKRCVVIAIGGTIYAWDFLRQEYRGPFPRVDMPMLLRDSLHALKHRTGFTDWSLDYMTNKGDLRTKKPHEIMNEYGTPAAQVIADLSAFESRFDLEAEVFHEACSPIRRELEPFDKPDPLLDEYLRLLAGKHAEDFLDWMAALPILNKPACAMYLHGEPGCGKNMLAAGIARLFTKTGSTTDLGAVLSGDFNAEITRCPILFLDEGFSGKQKELANIFRSVIGAHSFTINQKYIVPRQATGSVRVLIAANNDGVLDQLTETKLLSREDEDAIKKRIYYIRIPPAAKAFLDKYNKRDVLTEKWVQGDMIARQILTYFRDRDIEERSGRFLVDGNDTNWHARLSSRGETTQLVLDWIVEQASKPLKKDQVFSSFVLWQEGNLYVNSGTIRDSWEQVFNDNRPPSRHSIEKVIKNYTTDIVHRVKNKRYWQVDLQRVLEYADPETTDVGDPETIIENIKKSKG